MDTEKFTLAGETNPNEAVESSHDRSYREETKANGIDIETYWDRGHNGYVIFFPQIEVNNEFQVSDQIIILDTKDKLFAKKVFEFAAKEAANSKDAYELWHKVNEFIYPKN